MKQVHERILMVVALTVLPLVIVLFGIRPTLRKNAELKAQIQSAFDQFRGGSAYSRISRKEEAFILDPDAEWRNRMPFVQGDTSRLTHYGWVVGELQFAFRSDAAPISAIRSSWDPIQGDFSLADDSRETFLDKSPVGDDASAKPERPFLDKPEYQASGWLLDVEVAGNTESLFRALGAVHKVEPLLEPVGLHWVGTPGNSSQRLFLRNLILVP